MMMQNYDYNPEKKKTKLLFFLFAGIAIVDLSSAESGFNMDDEQISWFSKQNFPQFIIYRARC